MLLWSLTNFANLVLRGKVPQSVMPIFFGANLISRQKKDGGIRPIAVGQTLRRLVAKCISSRVTHSIESELAPLQLGCGVPLGCEAAAHATRLYLQSMPSNHLLAKLNFRNAFNSLRRNKMLRAVCETAPELFDFVNAANEHPSFLFCGEHTLESAEGVQQGDRLGPLLFCLTIQPLFMKLQSAFKVFYLDDGTIGGSAEDIIRDLRIVEYVEGLAGLELNHTKAELVCDVILTSNAVLSTFSDLKQICCDRATLFGTPIGSVGLIDSILISKVGKLK